MSYTCLHYMSLQKQEGMTKKERRMAKAVRLHYMEDMTYSEIADTLGLATSTVKKYFADDQIKQLRRHFSDQEKYELQRTIQQQVKDAENIAHECVSQAKTLADSSRAYNKTAKTALMIPEKKINMLQELGIVQKPKERKEIEDKTGGPAEVNISMDLVEDSEEVQDEEKQEVEAQ